MKSFISSCVIFSNIDPIVYPISFPISEISPLLYLTVGNLVLISVSVFLKFISRYITYIANSNFEFNLVIPSVPTISKSSIM